MLPLRCQVSVAQSARPRERRSGSFRGRIAIFAVHHVTVNEVDDRYATGLGLDLADIDF